MIEKYGFVYLWYDRKHKRYYVGSHWGTEDDGYVCSSTWMKQAYLYRPEDFKRRILSKVHDRTELYTEENRWLEMIKEDEMKPKSSAPRYYNLRNRTNGHWYASENAAKTIGQKISEAKKGKSTGPRDPSVGRRISEVKRKKFEERREETGSAFSDDHRKNLSEAHIGQVQSEETRKKRSDSMRAIWDSGARKRKEKKERIVRTYKIVTLDGTTFEVNNLRGYCRENGIPYVTLSKAFQNGAPSKKHGIASVSLSA